jgi:hypothetical protein
VTDLLVIPGSPNATQKPASPKTDLLDDLLDISSIPGTPEKPSTGLEDLLSIPKPAEVAGPPNSQEVARTTDFVVFFEVQKNEANPKQIAIRASVYNVTGQPLTNVNVQYGVPVGWFIAARPLSANTVEAGGSAPVWQVLMLENRGMAGLVMKMHATYMFGCQPLSTDVTLKPFNY